MRASDQTGSLLAGLERHSLRRPAPFPAPAIGAPSRLLSNSPRAARSATGTSRTISEGSMNLIRTALVLALAVASPAAAQQSSGPRLDVTLGGSNVRGGTIDFRRGCWPTYSRPAASGRLPSARSWRDWARVGCLAGMATGVSFSPAAVARARETLGSYQRCSVSTTRWVAQRCDCLPVLRITTGRTLDQSEFREESTSPRRHSRTLD